MSKIMIGVYLKPEVKEIAEKLATMQGKRLSEYVRGLIVDDLDKRSVFTTKLKDPVIEDDKSNPNKIQRR